MLDRLSAKLEGIFKRLKGRGVLNESDLDAALKEVRLALLEADVHFKVVRDFLDAVRQKALGREVRESLTPGQQVVKIVWEELRRLMGETVSGPPLPLSTNPPTVVMLVGLQGSGKTTTAAKLANRFKREGRRVLLAAADPRRPAAVEQLVLLGRQIGVETHPPQAGRPAEDAVAVCREAAALSRARHDDLVILDTAGRLHVDDPLMEELKRIKADLNPHEVLLVADAMTGQDAVRMALRFHQAVGLTGIILTKLDGDARGGAVLSIRAVTGLPVRFIGAGEKLDALEPFHPDRMASRILGMGDVLSLIERAEEVFSKDQAEAAAEKWKTAGFSFDDFRDQIRAVRKSGSVENLIGMLPGMGRRVQTSALGGSAENLPDRELVRVEAIINSMTAQERRQPGVIDGSRRKRIARGSGTTVQEVNQLLKRFLQAKKLMKTLSRSQGRTGIAGLLRSL
ncbi:MAG: signal recognition particle protein [Nitrospirae bacterium]|nr:signal recognition particle protein [Nitrospirota bacterium]